MKRIIYIIILFAFTKVNMAQEGASLYFDGIDDQVIIANNSLLNINSGTIEAWIKTNNAGVSYRAIVSKELAYQITLIDNKLATYDWTTKQNIIVGTELNDKKWHHVAFTFQDGVQQGSQLYLDGFAIGNSFTYHIQHQASELTIGNNRFNPQNFYGQIDEVRIWNKALSEQEIKKNMHNELNSEYSNLVAYYTFNNGITGADNTKNDILEDLSGNENHGKLTEFELNGIISNWVSPGAVNSITINDFYKFYKKWRITIVLCIVTLLAIYFFIKIRLQFMKKENEKLEKIIESRTSELKSTLSEKDLLIQEIHHRVKNNLQFISSIIELEIDANKSNVKDDSLIDTSRRINAMSLVHELLYQQDNLEKISMKKYINQLGSSINEMVNTDHLPLKFNIKTDDLLFDVNQTIAVGMIISELVSNSIKHAFKNQTQPFIAIEFLKIKDSKIRLIVSDNGSGYTENGNTKKSMGHRLVDMFSRQLKGTYTIDANNGFLFTLDFGTKL